jgi:transcriptional regulator with XRE-family HTH domain
LTENKPAYMFKAMKFGERLRIARKRKGLTQAALAELVGITQPTVHHLEDPKKDASGSEFTPRFARVLGVSADWLADEIGEMIQTEPMPTTHIDLSPSDKQTLNNAQYLPPDALDALIEDARLQAEEKRSLYAALLAQRQADETREPEPEPAPPPAPPRRTRGKPYKLPEPGIARPHAGTHKKRSA